MEKKVFLESIYHSKEEDSKKEQGKIIFYPWGAMRWGGVSKNTHEFLDQVNMYRSATPNLESQVLKGYLAISIKPQ